MRSRARFNAPKKILGYRVAEKDIETIKAAAEAMEAEFIHLGDEASGQIVGYLAGFNGFKENTEPSPEAPDKECLIFSGFDSKTLDKLLDRFDESGYSTDLMCVITSENQKIPLYQLIKNLWAEHLSMSK